MFGELVARTGYDDILGFARWVSGGDFRFRCPGPRTYQPEVALLFELEPQHRKGFAQGFQADLVRLDPHIAVHEVGTVDNAVSRCPYGFDQVHQPHLRCQAQGCLHRYAGKQQEPAAQGAGALVCLSLQSVKPPGNRQNYSNRAGQSWTCPPDSI